MRLRAEVARELAAGASVDTAAIEAQIEAEADALVEQLRGRVSLRRRLESSIAAATPVGVPRPGRKPRRIWRIDGSASLTFPCDPTGNRAKVDLEIPIQLVAGRAA